MLNMTKGFRIQDPALLFEGYERMPYGFAANVNAQKIQPLMESFVAMHNEPCFVILEVPTNAKEETALASDGTQSLHKDVYYLDGLSPDSAGGFLSTFGEWLIHDGVSSFGIGIHSNGNEIIRGKYNVVTVFTNTPEKYAGLFAQNDIPETADLKTAWDYFSQESPGESLLYTYKGKNVYDLVEHLKQYGLYFAERRED